MLYELLAERKENMKKNFFILICISFWRDW